MTISLTADLNTAAAQARLREIIDRLDNRLPFFREVGDTLAASTRRRIGTGKAPDGSALTPLRPATIKARTRKGQTPIQILKANVRSGSSLAGSIGYEATADEARVGAVVRYAAIHQLGGTINKPARTAKIYRNREEDGSIGRRFVKKKDADVITDVEIPAHRIKIPARPFLGISKEDQEDIFDAAERWLMP